VRIANFDAEFWCTPTSIFLSALYYESCCGRFRTYVIFRIIIAYFAIVSQLLWC